MNAPSNPTGPQGRGIVPPSAMRGLRRMARDHTEQATITIVVAFFNEEKTIREFFREMDAATATLKNRIDYVCINDGSRDATLELLYDELSRREKMTIIDLARNFGKEAAITAGLAQARGDAVIVIDADLQDPPSVIPQFISRWAEGYDVVYGVRASRRADSMLKRITARMFYGLFNWLTDVPIPAGAGDFRLLDRRVVEALLALPERNRFMKGLFAWIGFRQIGVEFVRQPRSAGKSKWNYLRLFNFALDGITSFSILPLRMASLMGTVVSLAGFAYAVFLIVRTLAFGVDVPGYASFMVVVLFLGGVQLLCLGLIGEYLGRLYVEAKGRPLYVVSNIYSEADAVSDRTAASGSDIAATLPYSAGVDRSVE